MKIQLSRAAQNDIKAILRYSLANFGDATMARYQALIAQAIEDIACDPNRIGVRAVPKIEGYYRYHLKMSRSHVGGQQIHNPSHFIVFRQCDNDVLEITRLLHEHMLIERHIH